MALGAKLWLIPRYYVKTFRLHAGPVISYLDGMTLGTELGI